METRVTTHPSQSFHHDMENGIHRKHSELIICCSYCVMLTPLLYAIKIQPKHRKASIISPFPKYLLACFPTSFSRRHASTYFLWSVPPKCHCLWSFSLMFMFGLFFSLCNCAPCPILVNNSSLQTFLLSSFLDSYPFFSLYSKKYMYLKFQNTSL